MTMFDKTKLTTLSELIAKEQIFAPCVWDCFSTRAAEICGYKAVMLSGGALNESMIGRPDMAFLNVEELIWATDRICRFTPLPVAVDADDGYGESPLVVYHNVERLAKAGAMAITIEDATGIRGWERLKKYNFTRHDDLVPGEIYLAKTKAAIDACKGTDCMVIARTNLNYSHGLDKAMDLMNKAMDLGADMSLILGRFTLEECRRIGETVKGPKMYGDVWTKDGKPDVELHEIEPFGFSFVTMHYMEKAALWGMLDMGIQNLKNKSTVYSETHDLSGYSDLIIRANTLSEGMLDYEEECYKAGKR
jgi:2-methylisocitrate lyase-like PEP mutase family enzyme